MTTIMTDTLNEKAIGLLCDLIAIPSFSREEHGTADRLAAFFGEAGIAVERVEQNIIVRNRHFEASKPSLLLNSHHDTVKPAKGWNTDPFSPVDDGEKIAGLGSNDAGGALVSLIAAFLHFEAQTGLRYNLILACTAEEEISGRKGIALVYPSLGEIAGAIVGEPTQLQMAVAEKGLLVIDCISHGVAGHAARNEGSNAITKAMNDIAWFENYRFEKISPYLGEIKMNVTLISAGTQHNVIPAECRFTVDIRLTDQYTHEEVLAIIRSHVSCEVQERSTRIRPSSIHPHHPIVLAASALGITTFGSSTCSDQALIPAPSVKIGPGDSARSHTADEFIYHHEIEAGITTYIQLLEKILH